MNEPVSSNPTTLRDLAEQHQQTDRQVALLTLTPLETEILGTLEPRKDCPPHSLSTNGVLSEVNNARASAAGFGSTIAYTSPKTVYEALDKLRRKGLVEGTYGIEDLHRVRLWSLVVVPA